LVNNGNLRKIIKVIHTSIKKKLHNFLKKNKTKKIVILDIPLLLENKINKKKDILIFVQSKKSIVNKKLLKRKGYNKKLLKKFKNIQLSLDYKKKKISIYYKK
jgi:dephospho-CoA kinase